MIEINLCARDKAGGARIAPAERVAQLQQFFQNHRGTEIVTSRVAAGVDGAPVLSIMLHPAAPLATFAPAEDGRLMASVPTLPAGPGMPAGI